MIEIGQYHKMTVVKEVDFGLYLSKPFDDEEILLPLKYIPSEDVVVGSEIEVFIYLDSEDRIIATTLKPVATANQFAFLPVVDDMEFGAFLDFGIAKDLLVPIREQAVKMKLGKSYLVYITIDEISGRLIATSKWNKFIKRDKIDLVEKQEVEIIIADKTDLGYKAIINNEYEGVLYFNELYEVIYVGDKRKAYIKKIREDNKIDLSLKKLGFEQISDSSKVVLDYLIQNNGYSSIFDKSSPEEIEKEFKMSKKEFKKAVGNLYREKKIEILLDGMRLLN